MGVRQMRCHFCVCVNQARPTSGGLCQPGPSHQWRLVSTTSAATIGNRCCHLLTNPQSQRNHNPNCHHNQLYRTQIGSNMDLLHLLQQQAPIGMGVSFADQVQIAPSPSYLSPPLSWASAESVARGAPPMGVPPNLGNDMGDDMGGGLASPRNSLLMGLADLQLESDRTQGSESILSCLCFSGLSLSLVSCG